MPSCIEAIEAIEVKGKIFENCYYPVRDDCDNYLQDIARFSLVFSFALLPVAMIPLMLHLQHPLRGAGVMLTTYLHCRIPGIPHDI